MPRFNIRKLDKKEQTELTDLFYEAVKNLKTKQGVIDFFKDLLTDSESVMLSRRLLIAKMILEGKLFSEIREELGASNDTINSVKHFLDFGSDGYVKAIKRLEN